MKKSRQGSPAGFRDEASFTSRITMAVRQAVPHVWDHLVSTNERDADRREGTPSPSFRLRLEGLRLSVRNQVPPLRPAYGRDVPSSTC